MISTITIDQPLKKEKVAPPVELDRKYALLISNIEFLRLDYNLKSIMSAARIQTLGQLARLHITTRPRFWQLGPKGRQVIIDTLADFGLESGTDSYFVGEQELKALMDISIAKLPFSMNWKIEEAIKQHGETPLLADLFPKAQFESTFDHPFLHNPMVQDQLGAANTRRFFFSELEGMLDKNSILWS